MKIFGSESFRKAKLFLKSFEQKHIEFLRSRGNKIIKIICCIRGDVEVRTYVSFK